MSSKKKGKAVRYESPRSEDSDAASYYSDEYTPSFSGSEYSDQSDYSRSRRGNRGGNNRDRRRGNSKGRGGRSNRRRDYTPSESEEDEYDIVKGLPYLVDNSIIRAPTDGLSFRRSPNMSDRDGVNCVKWGVVVFGIPIGTDWLQVGDRYLPMKINGTQILVPQVGALTGPAMTSKDFKAEARAKKSEDKKLLDRKITEAQIIARKHQTEAEKRRQLLDLDRQQKTEAAIKIQAMWRGYQGRQTVTHMVLGFKKKEIAQAKREKNEKARQERQLGAFNEKKRQELAALKIQSRARMLFARKEYSARIVEKQKEEARKKSQEELDRKRTERERLKLWQSKRDDAIIKLQNRARMIFAKKQVSDMKSNYVKQAKREENAMKKAFQKAEQKAATKIQAIFRGKKAREEVKAVSEARQAEMRQQEREKEKRRAAAEKKRQEIEARQEHERRKKREMAAITLQTRFRGWRDRKNYKAKVHKKKERQQLDKRLKAMKAQEFSGRPLRFVAPHEGARPWDRWQSKPSSKTKPVQSLRYNPKYGPPKFQTFATGESSIEEEVSAAERAIEERLTWAGSQRRLARPARYMTQDAVDRTLAGDPFDFTPPGDLRGAVMDNGYVRASGVVGRAPLQPHLERKKMQQRLKRMEDQQHGYMKSSAERDRQEKDAAAVKLQSAFRGKQARGRTANMREERRQLQTERQRQEEKQRSRQQAEKKLRAMELKNQREMERSQALSRREQDMAAAKIQSSYRGRQTRRQLAGAKNAESQRETEAAAVRARLEMRGKMEQRLGNLDLPVFRMAELGFASMSEVNGAGSCPLPSNGPMAAPSSKAARQRHMMGTGESLTGRGPATPASAFSPSPRKGGGGGWQPTGGAGRPAGLSPGPGTRSPRALGGRISGLAGNSPGPGFGSTECGAGALPPPEYAGKTPPRAHRDSVTKMLVGSGAAHTAGSHYQGPAPSASGPPPPSPSLAMLRHDLRVR